jgi:hypothetical protein
VSKLPGRAQVAQRACAAWHAVGHRLILSQSQFSSEETDWTHAGSCYHRRYARD